jgi:hypothetical protein
MIQDAKLDSPDRTLYHDSMRYSQPYHKAVALQRLVAADAEHPDCTRKERCILARAFVELETLKLRLRMKPAPKPIDVSVKPKSKARGERAFAED